MKETAPSPQTYGEFDEYLKNQFEGTDGELKRRLEFQKKQLAAPAINRFREEPLRVHRRQEPVQQYLPIKNEPHQIEENPSNINRRTTAEVQREQGFPEPEQAPYPNYMKGKSTLNLEREIGDMILKVERGDLVETNPEQDYVQSQMPRRNQYEQPGNRRLMFG